MTTNFTYYWQFKENPIVSETGTSPKSRTVTPALLELPSETAMFQ
jgi:hypothetical protein